MEEITTMFAGVMPVLEEWLRKTINEEVSKALAEDHMQQKPERMLSRDEVCQLLHISKPTLWARTKNGEITCTRVGRRVLYSESEIKKMMEG